MLRPVTGWNYKALPALKNAWLAQTNRQNATTEKSIAADAARLKSILDEHDAQILDAIKEAVPNVQQVTAEYALHEREKGGDYLLIDVILGSDTVLPNGLK